MDLATQIIGLLVILVPFVILLFNKYWSQKAAEKKRRAGEDKAAHDARKKAQEDAAREGSTHDKQIEAEKKWRERKE